MSYLSLRIAAREEKLLLCSCKNPMRGGVIRAKAGDGHTPSDPTITPKEIKPSVPRCSKEPFAPKGAKQSFITLKGNFIMKTNETTNIFGAEDEIVLAPMAEATPSAPADNAADVPAEKKKRGKKPPHRVEELRELREANKQVFRMNDGTLQAVFTPNESESSETDDAPVMEEDGKHYRQRRAGYTAHFSRDEENDELFSVEKGEYRVTVSAKKKKRPHPHGTLPTLRHADAKNALVFKGVKDGTDYEYTAEPGGVKENIIVKKKGSAYAYSFLMKCEGVCAVMDEAASRVSFRDPETDEEIFFIPAPFMTDAEGNRSEALTYALTATEDQIYSFTVTADAEWMNADERAFPVVIDPQIQVTGSNTFSTYSWKDGVMSAATTHTVGITASSTSDGEECPGDGSGSSKENAIPLSLDQSMNGSISTSGAEVWYKLTAMASGCYTFSTEGSLDTVARLYDASDAEIAYNDDSGNGLNFRVSAELSVGQTYYLMVKAYSSKTGSYILTASAECINGTDSLYSVNRMYMSFQMPSLPAFCRIKRAVLTLENIGTTVNMPALALYALTGNIYSGNCEPIAKSYPLDVVRKVTDGACSFDITAFADALNKGETVYPRLMLRAVEEAANRNSYVSFNGATAKIELTYEAGYAVGGSYRAHSHELGRFGQGSIDLAYGHLTFESEDFAWAGNRMPVTIKHLYHSALAGHAYSNNAAIGLHTADFSAMNLGYGFRLNLMQSMVPVDGRFVHIGENGEERYFAPKDKDNACPVEYVSEDEDAVYNTETRILKEGDTELLFDAAGRLIKQTEGKNTISITHSGNRISTVTDSIGRVFAFAYNASGYLTAITAPDGAKISYTYSGNLLTGIAYPNGKKAVVAYSSSKPASVTLRDANGVQVYQVAYTFSGNRVVRITEYGESNAEGVTTAYNYSVAARRTTVTTTEVADESATANVIKTVYTFDDEGNTVSEYVYSEDTGNVGADGEESGIHPHSGDGGAGIVSNINNLLTGHNFESLTAWPEMPANCGDIYVSNYAYESYAKFGKKLLRMQSYNADCGESGVYQVTNALPAGEYTFSAYIRVKNTFEGTDAPGVYLRVRDTADNILAVSERLCVADGEYVRLILPFTLTARKSVKVEILLNGKGTAYIDAAQLENNPYANAYNMLENGNFERSTLGWSCSDGVASVTDTRFNMSRSLRMLGYLAAKRYAKQTVTVRSARATRETFTLSGWAKGYALPVHDSEDTYAPTFRLRAVVKYKDTAYNEYGTEEFTADFSPSTEEWQLASVQFSKSKYRTVEDVTVYCEYDHNCGYAYFDDIQLVRNSIETDLAAEDFVTETDTEEGADEATEDSTASTTSESTAFDEAKDVFGNALTETTFTDGELGTIYRAFGFSENGNDLVSETDARGNETVYTVNGVTSRNEEVTDRLGNKTAYEYNASGRTTKVTSKNADGAEIAHVSYAYDAFDNMTEIHRGDGMKYALAYNKFHNLESIGIADKAEKLIQYTYKNGNGRLKEIAYANGDRMLATYNSIGQMVGERWVNAKNVETARYKYTYDGEGNIVRSIDFFALKEYNYEYEEGRIIRATECDIAVEGELIAARTVVHTVRYYYDGEGNLTKKVITPVSGEAQTIYYETADDKTVVKFTAGGNTVTSHSKTDSFGRKVFDELQLGTGFVSREFDYHKGEVTEEHFEHGKLKSSPTTQLVSRILLSDGRTISYEYDAEERITKVTDSVDGETVYTYDALGQLLTERRNGYMVNSMTYDTYGNILSKNGKLYTYDDDAWHDLLTAVDGKRIVYDEQGNPTEYLGHTLTWEKGRQLASFDSNTYTYNANGIRTSKTVGDVTHTYTLDGTKILRETWDGNTLIPLYDNEDGVCGILYNNIPYYFIKNLQGDIIAIANRNGKTVAEYSYDAWGVPTILSDSTGVIANINPFRYRGYYYDTEIGMYYLQSRYYDAGVGRFVNGDVLYFILNSKIPQDFNYYSYCANEPVSNTDDLGQRRGPKLVAFGIQVELGIAFASYGFEIIFANSNAYLFTYGGMAYGSELNTTLGWIQYNLTSMFSKKHFKKHIKDLFQAYISVCLFAVFNTAGSSFYVDDYKPCSAGVSFTIPTIYGLLGKQIGVKTYVATWSNLTSVGFGFVWPASLDMSTTYCYYSYRGCISMSNKNKNFVNKETKGLKP